MSSSAEVGAATSIRIEENTDPDRGTDFENKTGSSSVVMVGHGQLQQSRASSANPPKDTVHDTLETIATSDQMFLSSIGEARLPKDYFDREGKPSDSPIDSIKVGGGLGDKEDIHANGRGRFRRPPGSKKEYEQQEDSDAEQEQHPLSSPSLTEVRSAQSMDLDGNRQELRLPPEPATTVTSPAGEKFTVKRTDVHPNTNFDIASGFNTPNTSDNEAELSDVRSAQNLAMNLSPIANSFSARSVRTILRGDFVKLEQDMRENSKRCRTYVVATDLSEEAVYALEWTIGTILRDGDTLHACYAVYEEQGTSKGPSDIQDPTTSSVDIGEGARTMQETAAQVGNMTKKMSIDIQNNNGASPLSLLPATDISGHVEPIEGQILSARDRDRIKAVEQITNTCVRLLRKTKLVVRVAVEVIHCKSPKHMITEAVRAVPSSLTHKRDKD